MAYTPPAANAVHFVVGDAYTPPTANAVHFVVGDASAPPTVAYRVRLELPWPDAAPFDAALTMPWKDVSACRAVLTMPWRGVSSCRARLELPWAYPINAMLAMPWRAGQGYRATLTMPWRAGYFCRSSLRLPWLDAAPFDAALTMLWSGVSAHRAAITMPWAVVAAPYRAAVVGVWAGGSDVSRAALTMPWFGGGTAADLQYSITCTFAGAILAVGDISIKLSRAEYGVIVTLSLAGDPDDLPGAVLPRAYAYLSEALQAAARAAAAVQLNIEVSGQETTLHLLATEISESIDGGIEEFDLVCESPAVLLDSPYALPLTGELGPGMAADIASDLVTGAGFPADFLWNASNWWITGGVLYANAETPIAVLRKMSDAIGGMIQSEPSGALAVRPYYPVSRKDWTTTIASEQLAYDDIFFNYSRQMLARDDYNSFVVGDQLSSTAALTYEEVDVAAGVKYIKAYEVPWTGNNPGLRTSSTADRVVIEQGQVIDETITAEQVEIVDGAGKTAKPIYQIIDRDYGDNLILGAISYAEDGSITTEISGQTLCLISYQTRYWRWTVRDEINEAVQLYAAPAWSESAITIVITFGDAAAASGFIVAEADATLNVDTDGDAKSQFAPGDLFHFLVQHDDTIRIESVAASSGVISGGGIVSRNKEQQLDFADGSAVDLSYIPNGNPAVAWHGRAPGVSRVGRALKPSAWPATGDASYSAAMRSYSLTPPAMSLGEDETFRVLINITVVSTTA